MKAISKEKLKEIRDIVKKMQALQLSKNGKDGKKTNFAGMGYTR
jgi:hypothetical protein